MLEKTHRQRKQRGLMSAKMCNGYINDSGIEIWRIENFKVIEWPKKQYGEFYSGDSYIVLRTYHPPNQPDKLAWDIHFWLGKETTLDEAGTAAYKTVELDDYLGGGPVEHREVQGFESPLFLSYFEKFVVLEGGIASGFHHVKAEEYKHRLLQIRIANKKTIVREVPFTSKSLNSNDVFILDAGLKIYQWNGADSL